MKRQNSCLSSSSQVEIPSDNLLRRSHHRSKSFGCVSGLLHFLSNNNHTRRNKSITFIHNHNQELDDAISQPPKPESAAILQISSSDSPQIAERSESAISATTAERFRGARGPIVRLMGLESSTAEEDGPAATKTATEKQREVMQALEKCERDLKALKEFIDAFESTESFRSSSPAGEGKRIELMAWEQQQQEPSPVSVLEELSRRRHFVNRHGCNNAMFFQRPSAYSGRIIQPHQRQQLQKKKPGEEDIFNLSKFDRTKIHEELNGNYKAEKPTESPLYSNKLAMRDSAEGVCKDIAWGQKREVGRIGLALQHQICGDLIEELVKDLKLSYSCSYSSLPFEACKRRLCF